MEKSRGSMGLANAVRLVLIPSSAAAVEAICALRDADALPGGLVVSLSCRVETPILVSWRQEPIRRDDLER